MRIIYHQYEYMLPSYPDEFPLDSRLLRSRIPVAYKVVIVSHYSAELFCLGIKQNKCLTRIL